MTNTAAPAAAPSMTDFLKGALAARIEVRRTGALAHNGTLYGLLSLEDLATAIRAIQRPLLAGDRAEAIDAARRALTAPSAYADGAARLQATVLGAVFVEWFEAHLPA